MEVDRSIENSALIVSHTITDSLIRQSKRWYTSRCWSVALRFLRTPQMHQVAVLTSL
jgi:hypothetical protein